MADTGQGHNGGPPLPRGRRLSEAQARALRGIRDHGNGAYGLSGRSAMGGYNNTQFWLDREGLRAWNEDRRTTRLTERGVRVLEAGRMVD